MATNILHTTQSRVFLTLSKSGPGIRPAYQDCMVLGTITQSFGDREPIYCQDPFRIGRFKTIGFTESPAEPAESSLNARYPFDARSPLVQAARAGAPVDLHVHMGAIGSNPQIFSTWSKKIVFEGVRFSSLDVDEIGAHDEDTVVGHEVSFTADSWYEIMPQSFSERAVGVSSGAIRGVHLFYNGRLDLPPRERILAMAVTGSGGGSPGTSPDFLFSLDEGTTWRALDVNTIGSANNANDVAVIGDYVVIIGGGASTYGMHITRWDGLNPVTTPSWTRVSTGFAASAVLNAMSVIGSVGFIAANGGYVYKVTDAPSGAEVMTAGTISAQNLNAISAFDENTIVAVGASNTVLVCLDGENFSAVTGPSVGVALTAVAVLSENVFLVGTADGHLFYTTDAGVSWTEKSFQGAGASGAVVNDLDFGSSMIGYMAFEATGVASLLMTTDAGYSWDVVPSGGVLAYSTGYTRVASFMEDPNVVIAGGPNDDDTTGSILMGEPIS